jgi:hypothetical protein
VAQCLADGDDRWNNDHDRVEPAEKHGAGSPRHQGFPSPFLEQFLAAKSPRFPRCEQDSGDQPRPGLSWRIAPESSQP